MNIAVDVYFSESLVDEGYLILEDEEIMACFKPVLERFMGMVESQIIELKPRGGEFKVTTTFSVASLYFITRDRLF